MALIKSENSKKNTVLLLGDSTVGKTSLIQAMAHKQFKTDFIDNPFAIENEITIDENYILKCFDMSGLDGFEAIRKQTYQRTSRPDAILLCFSLASVTSFNNIDGMWITEATQFYPGVPIFLIGTKAQENSRIGEFLIESLLQAHGIKKYYQCANDFPSVSSMFTDVCSIISSWKENKRVAKFLFLLRNRKESSFSRLPDYLIHRIALSEKENIVASKRTLEELASQFRQEQLNLQQPVVNKIRFENKKKFTFLLLGDGTVGKTSIITAMKNKEFNPLFDYPDLSLESVEIDLVTDYKIECIDVQGQEDYSKLRITQYQHHTDVDAILLCFNLTKTSSIQNIEAAWLHEARLNYPKAPLFLIGTHAQEKNKMISKEEINKVIQTGGIAKYYECSNNFESIQKMFIAIVKRLISIPEIKKVSYYLFLVQGRQKNFPLPVDMFRHIVNSADETDDNSLHHLAASFNPEPPKP